MHFAYISQTLNYQGSDQNFTIISVHVSKYIDYCIIAPQDIDHGESKLYVQITCNMHIGVCNYIKGIAFYISKEYMINSTPCMGDRTRVLQLNGRHCANSR